MLILYTTEDGALAQEATTEESSVVPIEGNREVQRPVALYNLDAILAPISQQQMEASTTDLYLNFDAHRKEQEALAADQADDAELKNLESKLKSRPKP
jgi:hypothetical protein